jgi:hypothetical protein
MDYHGNFSFEMKFNFGNVNIKKFVYIKEKNSFMMVDYEGRLYSFYYPSLQELVELFSNEIFLTLSQITGIEGVVITDIYAINDYLLLLDGGDNLYYLHVDNLGINYNKEELIRLNSKGKETLNNINNNNDTNLTNSGMTKIDEKIKIISIEKTYGKIKKICGSDDGIMFSDDSNTIFTLTSFELNLPGTVARQAKTVTDFTPKFISDMAFGRGHRLVLEREDIKPIEKWSEEDVQAWFEKMDLELYSNIIKYEKIKGKDIADGDEAVFLNLMNMQDDHIMKIKYELNNVKNISCRGTKLYGWGSNKQGQLGLMNYGKDYVKSPTLINLPEMKTENDFIVNVYCGKTFSLLLTKFGEIFITGNYDLKEKNNLNNSSQNYNSTNTSSAGKKNRVVEKHKNVPKEIVPNHRWVNVTKEICFDHFLKKNE